jgi:hypothetical protein
MELGSGFWRALAFAALALHVAWLGWILLGWVWTRGRPLLRWLHIGSLAWGIVVSVFPWTCPLTWAEMEFERRAGLTPYNKSFLEHYVERLVYPDVDARLLMACAIGVCAVILGVYAARFRRRENGNW